MVYDLLEFGIDCAEKLGANFAIIRFDEKNTTQIVFERDRIKTISAPTKVGIGVVIWYNGAKGYACTPRLTKDSVEETVKNAFKAAKVASELTKIKLKIAEEHGGEYKGFIPSVKKNPKSIELSEKINRVRDAVVDALKKYRELVSLTTTYVDLYGKKIILTSSGIKREWSPILVGVAVHAVVRINTNVGSCYETFGTSRGFEILDEIPEGRPENLIEKAVQGAKDIASAKRITPGKYPLVCDPDFAGVIAHESFGHLTEIDGIINKTSILCDKIGSQIGSEHATIIDSGDPVNFGWLQMYDDYGSPCETVVILEKGILKHFLTTLDTATHFNMKVTGNARAVDFSYPPIPRMRNTYFGPGDVKTREELFEMINRGVYVEKSIGGQTELTGNFTFGANKAYWIENGEIKYPLKAVNVRANILDFLKNVIGATREIKLSASVLGGCGKNEQFPLKVGLGGPYIAVKEAIIGG